MEKITTKLPQEFLCEMKNSLGEDYQKYLDLSKKYSNLHLLGRLANYKYINMDLAVQNALDLANSL